MSGAARERPKVSNVFFFGWFIPIIRKHNLRSLPPTISRTQTTNAQSSTGRSAATEKKVYGLFSLQFCNVESVLLKAIHLNYYILFSRFR